MSVGASMAKTQYLKLYPATDAVDLQTPGSLSLSLVGLGHLGLFDTGVCLNRLYILYYVYKRLKPMDFHGLSILISGFSWVDCKKY